MAASPSTPPSASARDSVALAELRPGEAAVVETVIAGAIGRRLLDLGFVPETPIRALRRAPLGDPTTYELRGRRICLRRSEALSVRVRRESR